MDLHNAQTWLHELSGELSLLLQKLPGSAVVVRYVKNSHQNDPIRSCIELFLLLFALRYLFAQSYSTKATGYVKLTDQVGAWWSLWLNPSYDSQEVDELVDEWTPEPLVAEQTSFEAAENEKRPVITG